MRSLKSLRLAATTISFALIAVSWCAEHSAVAAVYTWANQGPSWNAASNWGGTVPGAFDIAQFNSPSYAFLPVLTAGNSAGAVWQNGGGSLATQGGTLTLFGVTVNGVPKIGLEQDAGGGGLSINSALSLSDSQTWTNNSAIPMNILANVSTVQIPNRVLTITGSGNTLISGAISGGGLLTKSGPSILTLTGSDIYTGSTTVSGGTLQIGNGGSQGVLAASSPININSGGTLIYSETNSQNLVNNFMGSGTWTIAGIPSTVFSITGSAVGFGGTLNVNSGILSISTTGVGSGPARVPSGSASINVASGAGVNFNGASCNSNLVINGLGATGGGALTFQTTNNLGGNITLADNSRIAGTLPNYGAVLRGNVNGPFQLEMSGGTFALQDTGTYGSTLISGARLTVFGSNALSSGPLSISSGSLFMNGNSFSVADLSGSGGLIVNSSQSTGTTLTVGGDNSDTTYAGALGNGGSASLALTKVGTGSLTLGGSNGFSGPTNLLAGTIQIANNNALMNSPVTIGSGVLSVGSAIAPIPSLSGGGSVVIGGGSLNVGGNNANTTYSGSINGTGIFFKSGTGSLTLNGNGNFGGAVTLFGGALTLANTSGSALGSGTLTMISGELASAAGIGGATSGPVFAGGLNHSISPGGDGTIGSLGVGGLTINNLSTLRFDIADLSSFDQIDDSASLAFSGTGAATILVPNALPDGTYALIDYSSASSISAANLSLGIIGGGTVPPNYQLVLNPTELDLVTTVPEPSMFSLVGAFTLGLAAFTIRRRLRREASQIHYGLTGCTGHGGT
jgi:autotransporter-associated beta strand protein